MNISHNGDVLTASFILQQIHIAVCIDYIKLYKSSYTIGTSQAISSIARENLMSNENSTKERYVGIPTISILLGCIITEVLIEQFILQNNKSHQ